MHDGINGAGDTDRLMAVWDLASPSVRAAADGRPTRLDAVTLKKQGAAVALAAGPDGAPVGSPRSPPRSPGSRHDHSGHDGRGPCPGGCGHGDSSAGMKVSPGLVGFDESAAPYPHSGVRATPKVKEFQE